MPAGSQSALAALAGSWRLLSVEARFTDTGERVATFGAGPSGRLILTRSGRIMFLITSSNRPRPVSDAERASLFNQTIAYSGKVRSAGQGRFVTTVDISLFPDEIGIDKLRLFKLDGDRLTITRPEQTGRATQGRLAVSELIWERDEPVMDGV
jgi:hypothetical protein